MVNLRLAWAGVAALALASAAVAAPERGEGLNRDLLTDAMAAFHSGDYATAKVHFRRLANRDVAIAETLLGTMAAKGQGGPRNDAIAAAWFMRAARRGYAPAQLALANAFARGQGVKTDPARALALARSAARQGEPGADALLAGQQSDRLVLVAKR